MSKSAPHPVGAPGFVRRSNPFVLRALRLGLSMGPNVLLTVRGRRSGEERTFPVAILRASGRQFLFSAFGEVAWVHNLRASGTGTITRGRRRELIRATELGHEDAAQFLEVGLRSILKMPLVGSMIAGWYGIDRRSTPDDYLAAARRHPAFELHQVEAPPG